MTKQEEIIESPVQTKNEQIDKVPFIKAFKKIYLQKPIEEILNDFANCYLECSDLEALVFDLEEKLKTYSRKEVSNG